MCAASIESKELPSCWATWCLYTLSSTKSIELESVLQDDLYHLHVLQGLLLGVQQGVQQVDLQGEVPALLQDGRKNVFRGELAGELQVGEHQVGEHQDGQCAQFQSAAMGHDRHNSV